MLDLIFFVFFSFVSCRVSAKVKCPALDRFSVSLCYQHGLLLPLGKNIFSLFWICRAHLWAAGGREESGEMFLREFPSCAYLPMVLWRQATRNPLMRILLLVKESLRDTGHALSSSVGLFLYAACALLCFVMSRVLLTLLASEPLPARMRENIL